MRGWQLSLFVENALTVIYCRNQANMFANNGKSVSFSLLISYACAASTAHQTQKPKQNHPHLLRRKPERAPGRLLLSKYVSMFERGSALQRQTPKKTTDARATIATEKFTFSLLPGRGFSTFEKPSLLTVLLDPSERELQS